MPIRRSTAPRRFSAASLPPPTCSTATNRTARPPYSRLYQTITNLDRTAERTNHRLQAIIKALKQRDKETIAIEARLRQTMIDRIGDP